MTTTMRQILIAATLSMMWAGDASAMTGADLLQKVCRDVHVGPRWGDPGKDWNDLRYCWGFLAASSVAAQYQQTPVCYPDRVNNGIIQRVITVYLHRHPEKLHQDAMTLIFEAIAEAYPCQR